ncbi:MAG: GHKL domain-containing protein [Clostridia bacterium]
MPQALIWLLLMPIYGITVMAGLLNIGRSDFTKRKTLIVVIFSLIMVAINIFVHIRFGPLVYAKNYLFLVQLPVLIIFGILSHYRGIKLVFTLLTAVALSAIPVELLIVIRILTEGNVPLMLISFIVAYIIMLFLVLHFLRPNYIYMLKYGEIRVFWKFSIIPFLYYIYRFLSSGYNFEQYTDLNNFLFRRLPDLIVFASYVLLIDIFKKTNEKQMMKNEQTMMLAQMASAKEQVEFLKTTQEQTMLYRHDMRHHLSLIKGYLADGKLQKAEEYLKQTQVDIDAITPISYCENNTLNLIFSSLAREATKKSVNLSIDVTLPLKLPFSETELCALFSNALENAIVAASKVETVELRKVYLNCRISENRLLIYLENNYIGTIVLENGLPKTSSEGHGFGTKSMASIAAKKNGYFSCETENGVFILRIVLPLEKD